MFFKKKGTGMRLMLFLVAAVFIAVAAAPLLAEVEGETEVGDSITMSFTGAPVGYILQSLGRLYGVNFSISSAAAARVISVEMTDVTFEDALEMVSAAAGIKSESPKRGYYIVDVATDTSSYSQEEMEIRHKQMRLEESVMDIIVVNYVDVEDIEGALTSTIGENYSDLCTVKNLSQSTADRSYNSIVVHAANAVILERVRELVKLMDAEKPLVEIEATFIEITQTEGKNLGITWNPQTEPFTIQEEMPVISDGAMPGTPSILRFGEFWRTNPWTAEAILKAEASGGRSKVLANPKLRVMSGRAAEFASETQVPVMNRNSDGDISTEYKNVGISLKVLPTVQADGAIQLEVTPEASAIIGTQTLSDMTAPIIAQRRAKTIVRMRDGEAIVIGGLMNDKEIKNMTKVPILHKIPLFGELFKSQKTEVEKSTVIVLIRPKLIGSEPEEVLGEDAGKVSLWDGDRSGKDSTAGKTEPGTGKGEEENSGENDDVTALLDGLEGTEEAVVDEEPREHWLPPLE